MPDGMNHEYQLVTSTSSFSLGNEVSRLLMLGWRIVGSPYVLPQTGYPGMYNHYQAMQRDY